MWVYEVAAISPARKRAEVVAAVERCAVDLGLHKALQEHKDTRSHWHWRRAGVSGTLETTYDVREHKVLVSVHENRAGSDGWAKKLAPRFAQLLAQALGGGSAFQEWQRINYKG